MKAGRSLTRCAVALALILGISACGERPEIPKNGGIALLVIDCQRDYLQANGRMPVAQDQAGPMITTVNNLIAAMQKQAVPVIYTQNDFPPWDFFGNLSRNYAASRYTPGQTFDTRLDDTAGIYLMKHRPDAFSNDEMQSHLGIIDVSNLVLSGVFAEKSVLDTAKAALKMGYKVTVISDAVAGASDAGRDKALNEMKVAGAGIKTSSEFIGSFGQGA